MGALEEASQRHVQGFGVKVSSFPSPGASPTATRTTVNMLLTVLAITRWVTLDTSAHSCQAGRECPWPRPRGTSGPLWSMAGGCFRWWQRQVCSGIPWGHGRKGEQVRTSVTTHHRAVQTVINSVSYMHVSRTLLGQGWMWGTLREDSRRWCDPREPSSPEGRETLSAKAHTPSSVT